VRRLRDGAGTDLGGYRYTAFGVQFPADASTPSPAATAEQLLRWKGRWFEPVAGGMYDMRARWWSPQTLVFSQIDALAFDDARSSLWAWPNQNPVALRDPSGHCPWCIVGAGIIVLGFGALAPSDTKEAPANVWGLMAVTSAGFFAMSAAGAAGATCAPATARGASAAALEQITQGRSLQAAIQALNETGVTQEQAIEALKQITANSGRRLAEASLEGAPGTVVLTGIQFQLGGTTAAITIAPNGVATFGAGVANIVDGALTISEFIPK
jgi:RHS repeat-associated protein